MFSEGTFPKVQLAHLYQFKAVSGLILIVVAISGYATLSKDRRAAANKITMDYEDSFRHDVALQLTIYQADPSKAGRVQEHISEYVIRRSAEISTMRRDRLKENTAASLKVLAYYRGLLWVGIGLLLSGGALWYFLVQRHRDRIVRAKAKREERKQRRMQRAKKSQKRQRVSVGMTLRARTRTRAC